MMKGMNVAVIVLLGLAGSASAQSMTAGFLSVGAARVSSPDLAHAGALAVAVGGEHWTTPTWGARLEATLVERTSSSACTVVSASCPRFVPGRLAVASLAVTNRSRPQWLGRHALTVLLGLGAAHSSSSATLPGGEGDAVVGGAGVDIYNGTRFAIPLSAQAIVIPAIAGHRVEIWSLVVGVRR